MDSGDNNNRSNFNDQEQHYKSLIELFKYSVTLAGALLTIVGGAVTFMTYKDGQELRADQRLAHKEVQEFLKATQAEIREERGRMEQKASQSREELTAREKDLSARQTELENSVNTEIANTKEEALRQINGVKNEATAVARSEAKGRIDQVFREKNLESFIETVAKEKLTPQIQPIVDAQIKETREYAASQATESQLVNEITYILYTDSGNWLITLDSLARFGINPNNRKKAKKSVDVFKDDFKNDSAILKYGRSAITGDSLTYLFFEEYLPKYAKRPLPSSAEVLQLVYATAKNKGVESRTIGSAFSLFSRLSGKQVEIFDFEKLEKEYADYKKRPYPLRMGK